MFFSTNDKSLEKLPNNSWVDKAFQGLSSAAEYWCDKQQTRVWRRVFRCSEIYSFFKSAFLQWQWVNQIASLQKKVLLLSSSSLHSISSPITKLSIKSDKYKSSTIRKRFSILLLALDNYNHHYFTGWFLRFLRWGIWTGPLTPKKDT